MNCFAKYLPVILIVTYVHLPAQHVIIPAVPDHSQPPAQTLSTTTNTTNFCSPFAALNIVEYWELHVQHAYAIGVTAGLPAPETAEYIAWFMDTNDNGSPQRLNGSSGPVNGTYTVDQIDGFRQFIEYDSLQPHGFPHPIPAGKTGTTWDINIEHNSDFMMVATELDEGRPVKVDFSHWNIIPAGYDTLLQTDSIHTYDWGEFVTASGSQDDEDPFETWNNEDGDVGIGHAVTAVGYLSQFSIPGSGNPPEDYIIVHDNWANTPENVAVPWQNVKSFLMVHLPVVSDLIVSNLKTYVESLEVETLPIYQPVTLGITVKNQTLPWIPPFILITSVIDIDGLPLLTDTSYAAYPPNNQITDSMTVYLDSLFTPQATGYMDIQARVYWDLNADRIINDPPDDDLSNDYILINRQIGYTTVNADIHMIQSVPDFNQPPTTILPSTQPGNFCAPMAAANILAFWDAKGLVQTQGVTAGLSGETLAEYIGWFFDTNNQGNPGAYNGTRLPAAAGTYVADQDSNLWLFVRWDTLHPYMAVAPTLPGAKEGYDWLITADDHQGFPFYQSHIDLNYPLLLNFMHWNIHFSGTIFVDTLDRDTVYLYDWGLPINASQLVDPLAPEESWNLNEDSSSIGHAVTGIGYVLAGGLYAVVHDNWQVTHQKVCIPWQSWTGSLLLDPIGINQIMDKRPTRVLSFQLMQNYPNPFNPKTIINYKLPITNYVDLSIYNILGQKVATLVNEVQQAGYHHAEWNASNMGSGVYYYQIQAGDFHQVRKMILIK